MTKKSSKKVRKAFQTLLVAGFIEAVTSELVQANEERYRKNFAGIEEELDLTRTALKRAEELVESENARGGRAREALVAIKRSLRQEIRHREIAVAATSGDDREKLKVATEAMQISLNLVQRAIESSGALADKPSSGRN